MSEHLIDGQFQSDKYPTTPRGKVPLSCNDTTAQDLLWEYAQRRRAVDATFADDLEAALRIAGYDPAAGALTALRAIVRALPTCAGDLATGERCSEFAVRKQSYEGSVYLFCHAHRHSYVSDDDTVYLGYADALDVFEGRAQLVKERHEADRAAATQDADHFVFRRALDAHGPACDAARSGRCACSLRRKGGK